MKYRYNHKSHTKQKYVFKVFTVLFILFCVRRFSPINKGMYMLNNFEKYPFEKLSALLKDITPSQDYKPITLTIGEPQFDTPKNILDELTRNVELLNKYPKSGGEDFLRDSQLFFIANRYNLTLQREHIIPTFGTREVLFNFPQFYLYGKNNPTIAYPNPFYQIYEGAARASRAKTVLMELNVANNFKPTLTKEQLKEVDLVILNSPNNPTGATLSLQELQDWVQKALEYDFVILSDECYSEIYTDSKPASILEASYECGNRDFKNVLALNSISKRSSAPGLRSGFIAGDKEILQGYGLYRTYVGCAIPLPLQKASALAWRDFENPNLSRAIYAKNLEIAKTLFPNANISPYTFYVWLSVSENVGNVGNDMRFTQFLYRTQNIKVLPGSFLGRNGAGNGFVRLALVYESAVIKEVLERVKKALDIFKHNGESQ